MFFKLNISRIRLLVLLIAVLPLLMDCNIHHKKSDREEAHSKPKILLRSSWQTVNIGDIAHTPGVLALCEEYLPGVEVRLWASDVGDGVREMLDKRFPDLQIILSSDTLALKKAFDECDFLLHGSGPYLVADKDVAYWIKETHKPFGVYGITLPEDKCGEQIIDVLNQASFIYFRDTVSLELAKMKGVRAPVMEFGPDGAFACDVRNDSAAIDFLTKNELEEGKFLCVIPKYRGTPYWKIPRKNREFDQAIFDKNERFKEHDLKPYRDAIIAVVANTDMKVLICPEDETQMELGKEMLYDPLPDSIKPKVVLREKFWLTDEAVSTYIRSAGLFGLEQHSPIMCIGNGVPALVGRFEEQTSKGYMWHNIGLADWLFDSDRKEQMDRLVPTVLSLVNNREETLRKTNEARQYVEQVQEKTMRELRNAVMQKDLAVLGKLHIGSCNDAAVKGHILYVIGSKSIYTYDITIPQKPELLDKLSGLGNVRQIEIQDGYAYVTAREEGLLVIDISNPEKLRKVAHYDTLELGTGIDASGSVAAVTNRQYGVEFLNISKPEKPSFLAMIRSGEAQSVFLKDTIAVIGDWGTKEVVLTDITKPESPEIVSRVELDGYGDGVFVEGNLCFVATGHHGRKWKKNSTDSTYWGKGHGMEIIDFSDPYNPEKLSVLKFPVKYYMLYADTWDVQVSGNFAYVGDSEAGLFVVDIKDPSNPYIAYHATIPIPPMPAYMHSYFKGEKKGGPIGGFAVGDGVIYIAGMMNDLYIVEAPETAKPITRDREKITFSEAATQRFGNLSVYDANGQVHAAHVIDSEDKALIAAGDGGVHEVNLVPEIMGRQILETGTIVFDVFWDDEILYLAEGIDGFSVWNYDGLNEPQLINRYLTNNGGIYQLLIDTEQSLAVLHAGADHLEILDIKNFNKMEGLSSFKPNSGLLYRFPIAKGLLKNRFVAASWHTTGCFFYDLKSQEGIKFLGQYIPPLGVINGIAFLDDGILAVHKGGYIIQNAPDEPQLEIDKPIKIGDLYLKGKPTVYDNTRLYVSNRMKGQVFAVDISDPDLPKENWQLQISGNPGLVSENKEMVIVPGGHDGLLVFNRRTGKPYYGKN